MPSPTPRQYRPRYGYLPPTVNLPTPSKRLSMPENTVSIEPLHSFPTVAFSSLTASSNDISNPTPKTGSIGRVPPTVSQRVLRHTLPESQLKNNNPTRIPTPVPAVRPCSIRIVSSPAALTQLKEVRTLVLHPSYQSVTNYVEYKALTKEVCGYCHTSTDL
jgi:hypothetical protein